MPLDPAFADIVLNGERYVRAVERMGPFPNQHCGVWHSLSSGRHPLYQREENRIERLAGICRHSYRSMLDACGAPIGVQQKLLRHAQVSTTMQYGDAYMSEKRKAHRCRCADGIARKSRYYEVSA